jgi:hypothetical protein
MEKKSKKKEQVTAFVFGAAANACHFHHLFFTGPLVEGMSTVGQIGCCVLLLEAEAGKKTRGQRPAFVLKS